MTSAIALYFTKYRYAMCVNGIGLSCFRIESHGEEHRHLACTERMRRFENGA